MGHPRAKRRRKLTVLSSDDGEGDTSSTDIARRASSADTHTSSAPEVHVAQPVNNSRISRGLRPNLHQTPSSQSTTESSYSTPEPTPPRVTRSKAKHEPVKKLKSKPIFSFFNAATQRQQQRSASPRKEVDSFGVKTEDDIQDDLSDEARLKTSKVVSSSSTVLAYRKRSRSTVEKEDDCEVANRPPSNSQGSLKPSTNGLIKRPLAKDTNQHDEDPRPWTAKYGPVNLDELAVHKKKVSDVRGWLEHVFGGRGRQRLLLLKGAAGTGKTTTLLLLCKSLGVEVVEWQNPAASEFLSDDFVSSSTLFEDFLGRTRKFGSLDFVQSCQNSASATKDNKSLTNGKQVILVEEFPNTFTRSSSVLESFRATVKAFLAADTTVPAAFYSDQVGAPIVTPVVMIISETLLSTSTAAADSFTAHRLLGAEILNHPCVSVIEFNAIAPTILAKALELVISKEGCNKGRRKMPSPQIIKELAQIGDVRSAVSSLQFLSLGGDETGSGGKKGLAKAKRNTKTQPVLTKEEQESLEMVTRREASLGIFHAVGKVVYNKRDENESASIPQPPDFLEHHYRPLRSQVSPEALHNELGTDTQTLVAALHENYILSCLSVDAQSTFESINGCIEALSDADLLSPDRFRSSPPGRASFQGAASDNLRQDEIGFHVAVRGLLFSLPFPVKRMAVAALTKARGSIDGCVRGGKGDAFKMFYPTSLRLWREKEEVEGLVDLYVHRAVRGELLGTSSAPNAVAQSAQSGSVETWKSTFSGSGPASRKNPSTEIESYGSHPLVLGGSSARQEMLLEKLPYLAQIVQHNRGRAFETSLLLRDIEKITAFHGINTPPDNADDAEMEEDFLAAPDSTEWTTDLPIEAPNVSVPAIKGLQAQAGKQGKVAGTKLKLERLFLSDDDIEDD